MLEQELQLEKNLFFHLNGSESVMLDHFFWLYSYKWTWIPLYICFFIIFIYKKNWKEIAIVLLAVALVILLCDQISSGFFKPFFQRFRPTHHPDFSEQVETVFGYRGGRYGFISSHAANAFGFATFTALIFRNTLFTTTIVFFALINAYSRIYLGVHFISDVVVGSLVGIAAGYTVYLLYQYGRAHLLKVDKNKLRVSIYSLKQAYFLCIAYFFITTSLFVFNNQLVNILN